MTVIWRIRNPKAKQYTFRQKHVSGFLQGRSDYFFISNNIQEFILDTDIIPAISSDHISSDHNDNNAEGIRIRSRSQWYEEGEESSKFFLNLEKFNGMQSQICKIVVNDQEITDPNIILNEIRNI